MQIFPAATNIVSLTNNIQSVIESKRLLMLGRDCAVYECDRSQFASFAQTAPIEEISRIFDQSSKKQRKPHQLIGLINILEVYDKVLTLSTLEAPKIGSFTFLGPLIKKVQETYLSIPLSESLPGVGSLIRQYENAPPRSSSIRDLFKHAQLLLSKLHLEERSYQFFFNFANYSLHNYLGNKFVMHFEKTANSNICLLSLKPPKEIEKKLLELVDLSEDNLGFALFLYKELYGESESEVVHGLYNTSEEKKRQFIKEITAALEGDGVTEQTLRKFLTDIRDYLLRVIISVQDEKFGYDEPLGIKVNYSNQRQTISSASLPELDQDLAHSPLKAEWDRYHEDPTTPEMFTSDFLLNLRESVTKMQLSISSLQKLYDLAYRRLHMLSPPKSLPMSEKLALYRMRRSLFDDENFKEPDKFFAIPQRKNHVEVASPDVQKEDYSDFLPVHIVLDIHKRRQKASQSSTQKKTPAILMTPAHAAEASSSSAAARIAEVAGPSSKGSGATSSVRSEEQPRLVELSQAKESTRVEDAKKTRTAIIYDSRVLDFRTDPQKMLSSSFYEGKSGEFKEQSRIYHTFALAVDDYILTHGVKSKWKNEKRQKEDIVYSIPGEIIIDGVKKRGVFSYCFDEDNICYHRFFIEKKSRTTFEEYIEKGFWQVDFPPLSATQEKSKAVRVEKVADDGSYLAKEINSFTLEIADPSNKATIILYKIKE